MAQIQKDSLFLLAEKFVNQTQSHLFLTGKAGTGKTTFLRQIIASNLKQTVVSAPTGVAAINAGGVTLHSLFQLPFGMFLPNYVHNPHQALDFSIFDHGSLFKNARLTKNKRKLLAQMELLIIDEISMVKADTIDAVDELLRYVRKKPDQPFGGTQLLCIGDLLQLPPVVKEAEWEIMKHYYSSPFFFDAHVFKNNPPIVIEFDTIYRQQHTDFINLLNRVRNAELTEEELQSLNKQFYKPHFEPEPGKSYITLCSHNYKADRINQEELQKLDSEEQIFEASIEGNFSEYAYPNHPTLILKEGAQVMFVRNDQAPEKRYFNGLIGRVKSLSSNTVVVGFEDGSPDIELKPDKWEQVTYKLNEKDNQIKQEVTGTFKQFAIKPAWAVTIHKSQGLTFERAIIDAGDSFTEGQVYVALSRLTGPEGLVLKTPIQSKGIISNARVMDFLNHMGSTQNLPELLQVQQKQYVQRLLAKCFDCNEFAQVFLEFRFQLNHLKVPQIQDLIHKAKKWVVESDKLKEVGNKFGVSLQRMMSQVEQKGYVHLAQRVGDACRYFKNEIQQKWVQPLSAYQDLIKYEQVNKKFLSQMKLIEDVIAAQQHKLKQASSMVQALQNNMSDQAVIDMISIQQQAAQGEVRQKKGPKREKGASANETFKLFQEGVEVHEIASLRGLTESTIMGHLALFVLTGEADPTLLMPKKLLQEVVDWISQNECFVSSEIKAHFGESLSYTEVRIALNYWKFLNPQKAAALAKLAQ